MEATSGKVMTPSLLGKNAIITGGSRGIGLAIAQELISQGAKVVICSRTQSELKKALKSLNSNGKMAFGQTCDVSKLNDCKKIVLFSKKIFKGKIDILVNNAGIYGPIGPLEKVDLKHWKQTMEVNLLGAVYLSSLIIPIMDKGSGGKIINLCGSGVGGTKTKPRFSAYFTSKFSIAGFTEVLADELKHKNIQVNCISPGGVNTYLNEYLIKQGIKKSGDEIYKEALKQKKEGGTPPKLAALLVAFLASYSSDHLSGRLLSAKWNSPEKLQGKSISNNLYKLRRIDQELFYEKSK